MEQTSSRQPLEPAARAAVAQLIGKVGEPRARELLQVSRATLARLAGGLTINRGTAALVAQRLAEIGKGHAA